MKFLLVVNFETGDSSCPWWQEVAIVYGSNNDVNTIEDSLASYYESCAYEDKNYDEILEYVLNSTGIKWEWTRQIPECDCMKTIWV